MPVRRFTGSGSGGRCSARSARLRSLDSPTSLSFLSALDMWTLVPVHTHCFKRLTVDADPDDRAGGRKQV